MSDDKMRQAFEVWAWENGDSHFPDFSKDESDDRTYWGRVTELAWRAWQAAQRQGGEAVALCDGKEQEAFEQFASDEGMNMALHPLHYLFLNGETNAARKAWKAAIEYCAPQPQPVVPEPDWIACSERLPTVADADCNYHVWAHDRTFTRPEYSQCLFVWSAVRDVADITHWKPTGLKRPEPPEDV